MYKLQNVTFETSGTFGISNVQIKFIPFYHNRGEETIFYIVIIYLEMR